MFFDGLTGMVEPFVELEERVGKEGRRGGYPIGEVCLVIRDLDRCDGRRGGCSARHAREGEGGGVGA